MLYDDMKGAGVVIVLVMFRKMKGDVCFVLWFRVSIFCEISSCVYSYKSFQM